jgi:hypothetical protein
MNVSKMFDEMTKYVTEAFARIFGPIEEDMPDVGVQPFECQLYSENAKAKG